jgi:hypothetical protein
MLKSIFAALLLASASALAQPYVHIGFGTASLVAESPAGKQSSGSMSALGAGYRFGRVFALELTHLDASGSSGSSEDLGGGTRRSTGSTWDTDGIGVFGVAQMPVGPVSILARAGAHRLEGSVNGETTISVGTTHTTTFAPPVSWSAWMPAFALGADFAFSPNISLRAIAEHIDGKDGLARMRTFSASLVYTF